MRKDAQVNNEIARLTAALKRHSLSREARWTLREQIDVLHLRLSEDGVRDRYQGDALIDMLKVAAWLDEEEGATAPSANL
jgi:hypothetical protein